MGHGVQGSADQAIKTMSLVEKLGFLFDYLGDLARLARSGYPQRDCHLRNVLYQGTPGRYRFALHDFEGGTSGKFPQYLLATRSALSQLFDKLQTKELEEVL